MYRYRFIEQASRQGIGRKPLVAEGTPRERIVLDPGNDCPECGGTLRLIGEDVSEILELISAKLKLIEDLVVELIDMIPGVPRSLLLSLARAQAKIEGSTPSLSVRPRYCTDQPDYKGRLEDGP